MGYEHVVIHMRLTERWKIDPSYVDASTFWRLADKAASIMKVTGSHDLPHPTDVVMQHVADGGDEWPVKRALRVTHDQFDWYMRAYKKNGTMHPSIKMEYMTPKEEKSDELYRRNLLHNF